MSFVGKKKSKVFDPRKFRTKLYIQTCPRDQDGSIATDESYGAVLKGWETIMCDSRPVYIRAEVEEGILRTRGSRDNTRYITVKINSRYTPHLALDFHRLVNPQTKDIYYPINITNIEGLSKFMVILASYEKKTILPTMTEPTPEKPLEPVHLTKCNGPKGSGDCGDHTTSDAYTN